MSYLFQIALPMVALLLAIFISRSRRGDGGRVGTLVRRSDWASWNEAIREKESDLRSLREREPKI